MLDLFRIGPMLVPALLALWTAVACRRAARAGWPGADAWIWLVLAGVYVALAGTRTARGLGLLHGLGEWLRALARQQGWYNDRRMFQIVTSLAVVAVVVVLIVYGLIYAWDVVKRYRLAVGFTALTVGFGVVRFISLHEVDAWVAAAPAAAPLIDMVAAAGVSAIAVARLRQLARRPAFNVSAPHN